MMRGGDSRIEPGPQGPGDADNLQQTLLPVEQIEHGEPSPGLAFIFLGQGDAVLPRLPQQGRMVGEALGVVEHVCLGRRECDHGEQQDDESCHGMNQDCVASLGDPPPGGAQRRQQGPQALLSSAVTACR